MYPAKYLSFPDECTGIRVQVQHLKAYGSSDLLNGDLVDPRYHYITLRGKSTDIPDLAGTRQLNDFAETS